MKPSMTKLTETESLTNVGVDEFCPGDLVKWVYTENYLNISGADLLYVSLNGLSSISGVERESASIDVSGINLIISVIDRRHMILNKDQIYYAWNVKTRVTNRFCNITLKKL